MSKSLARYLDYVSGRRGGLGGALVRASLSVLAAAYGLGCAARRTLYAWGLLMCRDLDACVISVGNLTAGGTGKTPFVVWLGQWLQERGLRVAILSRGYGQKARGGESDETLLFRQRLPEVPHLVGANRYASGLRAIAEHRAECLVLDDGFQHVALGRDLDIVLVDALLPFGYGYLLPRGLLREPVRALRRADLVVLTRCDLATEAEVNSVALRVRELARGCPIVRAEHRPVSFRRHGTREVRPLAWVQGRKVFAFSALGNPEALPRTLRALGAELLHHEPFRDHHLYTAADLEALARQAERAGAEAVVTTEKDAVKIAAFPQGGPALHVLAVEFAVVSGRDLLVEAIERALRAD